MSIASEVVSQFQRMLGADGGELTLLEETPTRVRIRYFKGAAACEACLMSPEDLQEMIAEKLARQAPRISSVEIVAS